MSISNRTRLLEVGAVILTAIGKFIFMDALDARLPFVVAAIILWAGYIIYRSRRKAGIMKYWGFRIDNFGNVMRKVLPFAIAAVLACIGIGLYQNTINITWHIIPILILYPIWGVIQQFLLIALVAGNLQDIRARKLDNVSIIFISALLFGLIHYPFIWLMIGSFLLAIFYGWIYLRERNIYVLGLFHGWLGTLFQYTVVDRDPFVEMFGTF